MSSPKTFSTSLSNSTRFSSLISLLFYAELNGANFSLSDIVIAQNSEYSLTVYGSANATINLCTNYDSDNLCDIDLDEDDKELEILSLEPLDE